MRVELNSREKRVIVGWLKRGVADFREIPDIYNTMSIGQRLILGDEPLLELDREGKISLLLSIVSGFIDEEKINALFPTFEELLQLSNIVDEGDEE